MLIVGGGGAGLTASMLLSTYGVESYLVSMYPGTSHLPKAHVLNQRAMEVFREVGVDKAILERGTPLSGLRYTGWYAGFAGPHSDYGREIGKLESWGMGYTDPNWVKASPCPQSNLPQIRLEPLLKAHAEALAPGRIHFNHQFISLQQDEEGVTAVIKDRGNDREYTARASYLLCCDGGRTINNQLGVVKEGLQNLASNVSIYMSADLSPYISDPEVLIRWYINPDIGDALSCVLVPMGPTRWGPDSEEWVFHLTFPSDDERTLDDAKIVAHMRQVLGLSDFEPEIHLISRWTVEGTVASRLNVGRVFIMGDAAHRHPPTGGLGLNTAVQDAYNLCWKISEVLNHRADAALLETYEPERKPVAARVVQRSLENFVNHQMPVQVLGISMEKTPEENWERMRLLWSDTPEGEAMRIKFENQIATQQMEFYEHNVEAGYKYDSPIIVPDGTPSPRPVDDIHVYEPSTLPGSPLPHAWLYRLGKRVALCDLAGHGHFLLITGEEGEGWYSAAKELAQEQNLPLKVIRVSPNQGDWLDLRFDWLRQREVSAAGAVLVRPDRFVAWRSFGASLDPRAELERVLGQVLKAELLTVK